MRVAPPPPAARLAALAALALTAACAAPEVARSVDGQILVGRQISARAYALYAIGAEAEARGDLETALEAYELAEDSDPESADIWTRVGSVRCRLGRREAADDAFDRARAIDPDYAPAHLEQARCDLAAGRPAAALGRVERAVLLDPERDDGLLLRAEILRRLGRSEDARLSLRALLVRHPFSADAWRALHAVALEAGDRPAAEEAARRLRELAARRTAASERPAAPRGPLAELDDALVHGQLRRARRLARDADLPPAEIAVRAAALGRVGEAREQAELVSAADPSSASALVALAVAADLSGDLEALARACDALQAPAGGGAAVPPSPLARLLFAELLFRRIGRDAALAWLGPPGPPAPGARDPLSRDVERRVHRELAGGAPAAP
ncbi:tetratricopeptide repeat protein [Sorangium sp. So ce385]|uniref:tetratricopeptide repeat protein n=1 Tax=Sorangium sp. So ce385 TaxID=3133308 RepID=UPI003F5C7643